MQDEDSTVEAFRARLDPEFDYLADGLAPAIADVAREIVASTIETTVAPLKRHVERENEKAALEATNSVMSTFEKDHPDWKDHEDAMLKLAERIQPKGMTEGEYLDHLYGTVVRAAERTEARAAADREPQRSGPPANITFEEAFAAAREGRRWDDDSEADGADASASDTPFRAAFAAAKAGRRL